MRSNLTGVTCASYSPPILRAASVYIRKPLDCISIIRSSAITGETLRLLLELADACGLPERIAAMFRGDKINITEDRAVLHIALRAPAGERIFVDGADVVPQVHAVLDRMAAFCERVRSGDWTGHGGKRIRNIDQHRHRRLRSRAGNGLRGVASLQPTRA